MIAILPTSQEMTSRQTGNWFSTLTQPQQPYHGENYKQAQEKEEEATEEENRRGGSNRRGGRKERRRFYQDVKLPMLFDRLVQHSLGVILFAQVSHQ